MMESSTQNRTLSRLSYNGECTKMTLIEAIRVLVVDAHIEDFIYTVRECAMGEHDGYEGSSWDHPRVKRFSDAVSRLKNELREV